MASAVKDATCSAEKPLFARGVSWRVMYASLDEESRNWLAVAPPHRGAHASTTTSATGTTFKGPGYIAWRRLSSTMRHDRVRPGWEADDDAWMASTTKQDYSASPGGLVQGSSRWHEQGPRMNAWH